jgi:hypothetical protein
LQRIDDFLAGKEVDEDGTKLRSDPEIAAEQKWLYGQCREFVAKDDLADNHLELGHDELKLWRHSCGGRSAMSIADLGNFNNEMPYGTLKAWLNVYGRCLLVEQRTDCESSRTGIEAGVYRGKLGGRYPITLVVEWSDPGGRLSAAYFYDKHAKRIGLSASRQEDGSVYLDEAGTPPARFALRWVGATLEGSWTQEGKPPLQVELR